MKEYEQAILDAQRDIRAQRIDKPLPQRLLESNQVELYYGVPAMFDDYEFYEDIALNEIFLRVSGCEYARDHGNGKALSARSWLESFPVSTYDDYRPYVQRSMNGDSSTLYSDDTVAYILTSGTTGTPKIFAESVSGNFAKLLVMRLRGYFMRTAFPITGDYSARNLTFSNYASMGNAPDGKPILRASGVTARNMRKYTGQMNIIPAEFWELADIGPRERDYMIALMALSDENYAKTFSNNLAHLGRVLARIDDEADRMIYDIRKGTVSADIPAQARECMKDLLPPNYSRAADLMAILREYGSVSSKAALRETWPRFMLVSGWLNGSTGRDARRLFRRLPSGVGTYDMGYGSSEGKWVIPLKKASAMGAASPWTAIYEFRDLRTGALLHALDVEPKTFYELVVTTYSGLVRYSMKDVVYVEGFEDKTPIFSFCGKTNETVQVNGRVRDSHNIQALFAWLELSEKVEFDLVQACVVDGKLFFILESPHRVDYRRLLKKLNDVLMEHWKIPVEGIYEVNSAYEQAYFDSKELPGRGVSGIKVPTVVGSLPEERFVKSVVKGALR